MINMIRPTWQPVDDEQVRLLADAVRQARKSRQADSAKWLAILKARVAGIPDEVICDRAEESRATLNRRFGSRRAMIVRWAGDNLDEVQAIRPDARIDANGDLVVNHADGTGPVVIPVGYNVHAQAGDEEAAPQP